MTGKPDLEVSPAQKAKPAQHVRAYKEPRSRSNELSEAGTGDIDEGFRRVEDDNARYSRKVDAGSLQDEPVSADAEHFAGLINSESLSARNTPRTSPRYKPSEETRGWSSTVKGMFSRWSQKPSGLPSGNKNLTSQFSASQTQGEDLQVLRGGNLDISAALNGDVSSSSGGPAQPDVIGGDIPKVNRPRRSGLPNPYDFPQSPPKAPTSKGETVTTRRRGLKPRRNIEPVVEVVEEAPATAESSRNSLQMEDQRTQMALKGAVQSIPTPEEQTGKQKRATRSTLTDTLGNFGRFQIQGEKHQHKATTEVQAPLHLLSPIQASVSMDDHQLWEHDARDQAGLTASHVVNLKDDVPGLSRPRTRSQHKGHVIDMEDSQPKENNQIATEQPPSEVEKESGQRHDQFSIPNVSPTLLDSTPAKDIRKLRRPSDKQSQWRRPMPKSTKGRKMVDQAQKTTKEHLVSRPIRTRVSEGTQSEANEQDHSITQTESVSNKALETMATTSIQNEATTFIPEKTLKELNSSIKNSVKEYRKSAIKDKGCLTDDAKSLGKKLMRLTSQYQAMKKLKSANVVDVEKINIKHKRAVGDLQIIQKAIEDMEISQLGHQELELEDLDGNSHSRIVKDLHIYIIPALVEALNSAVESRQDLKTLEVSDMQEFYTIVKILHNLIKALEAQYQSVGRKAPRTKTDSIYQPTLKFRSTLRKLFNECGKKLTFGIAASRGEKLRQTFPSSIRKRKEHLKAEQWEEEEKFQQRIRERNKAIIASLNERRGELGLPPCSQPIPAPVASQKSQTPRYTTAELLNDIDHDTSERLTGVFGSRNSNSHPGTTPKEWTWDEMKILVDGLRRERGPSRYEKLATKLERTLDEIFERAKYLKIQMEYTLKRLQEEHPDKVFPTIKPWVENIGSEGFLS